MKHLGRLNRELDPTDFEVASEIGRMADTLRSALRDARRRDDDGLGGGGPLDDLALVIGLLAGSLTKESEEYALDLISAAACQVIDSEEDLARWF